ncbi:PLP-dependent aminotransferase family protein [Steroidobacter sp. S1-65]|uniref:PLP-dependent aminotransferase family protein n=1 Tax=Steroidobacter gossypii TaxID=2805490 RepID=A0ABS1WYA7_9GAMM|nr:PLP-dependent aminotransferase family protein [Steroidobacter gossypii]MBM0105956.1 PLP-dependent aminotransferase family protein [Steroidobacter gossypii]
MSDARTPIGFLRATPPPLGILGAGVREALHKLTAACDGHAELFRQHRFDGTADDKALAARWLSPRLGQEPSPDRIIVTNGTMNSLLLLQATLLGPGGRLATEAYTFPQVKVIASLFNVDIVGVEMDQHGLRADALEDICRSPRKPTALYCNPSIQSPTATVMPASRRRDIAEVARRYQIAIIEDEAQALYAEDLAPPIATFAPELSWYLMGLSKYLSLGIRTAFMVAPSSTAAQALLARVRTLSTWHPAPLVATLVMDWIRTGAAHAILEANRTELRARQQLVREVFQNIPGCRSSYGLHFWLPAPHNRSAAQLERAAFEAGVPVRASDLYAMNSGPATMHGVRPAIGDAPNREQLVQGLRVLRNVYEELADGRR